MSLWEREYQEERGIIPEKMRLAAAMCARVGEHEVALSLLRQALERDRSKSVDTKSTNFHGQMVLANACTRPPVCSRATCAQSAPTPRPSTP